MTYSRPLTHLAAGLLALGFAAGFAACGGESDELPATREDRLALLDAKSRELRELRAEIAELERLTADGSEAVDSRLVVVDTARATDFRREIELQATVESDEVALVTVEVPGRVTAVLAEEGQYVRRGQALVRIDLETVAVQQAELQAQLDLAEDILARQERLREQQIGTEVQYLEAKNAVTRLREGMRQLDLQAAKATVTAPISGTVERKTVNVGEYAAPGQPLMEILDAADVEVVADVPETYLTAVRRGQGVRVRFPALATERTGTIKEIGRTIDPANRTFQVKLALGNRDGALKPNMLAQVYLVDYENSGVVVAPSEAILEEIDGREYVYVAEAADGGFRAAKRYVATGENDATRRELLEGVEPGELLVTEGMRSLTAGEPLRLQSGATAAAL